MFFRYHVFLEVLVFQIFLTHNINLILDKAPCHSSLKVKNATEERYSKLLFIPKRLTCLLQPADVSWMRSLKHSFELKWTDWMTNSEKSFTKSGNMKSKFCILCFQAF